MGKEVLLLTAGVLVHFKEKSCYEKLQLIILLEIVEIWICISVIIKL